MIAERRKACGIDVHKTWLYVSLVDRGGNIETRRIANSLDGIESIRSWIEIEKCEVVAFESTSIYWRKLYLSLCDIVVVEVANAYYIKNIPGKKTDENDSRWIATLALNNQIKPSRVFVGEADDFRKLTRQRSFLVEQRTRIKNTIHRLLDEDQIVLASVLTDIFGKSGKIILNGIVNGESIVSIIDRLPVRLQPKKDALIAALSAKLSQTNLTILQSNLLLLNQLDVQIKQYEQKIEMAIHESREKDFRILTSVPGIGRIGASVLLAELGNINDFPSPDNLVGYIGLNPSVYQSAGVLRTGHITKQGNRKIRWILVECAQACIRHKGTALYAFYDRLHKRCGYKKAIVALARKLLTLIWHLLMNHEYYEDKGYDKKGQVSIPGFMHIVRKMGAEKAIEIIQTAIAVEKEKETNLTTYSGMTNEGGW